MEQLYPYIVTRVNQTIKYNELIRKGRAVGRSRGLEITEVDMIAEFGSENGSYVDMPSPMRMGARLHIDLPPIYKSQARSYQPGIRYRIVQNDYRFGISNAEHGPQVICQSITHADDGSVSLAFVLLEEWDPSTNGRPDGLTACARVDAAILAFERLG